MTTISNVTQRLSRVSHRHDTSTHPQLNLDPEEDLTLVTESLHLIESMFPGRIVILCHLKHQPAAPYVSACCKDILGYSKSQLQSFSPEQFLSLIHPDDMRNLSEGFKSIEQYSNTLSLQNLRFLFYYRLRHADGRYVPVRDERITIMTKRDKQAFFILLDEDVACTGQAIAFEVKQLSGAKVSVLYTLASTPGPTKLTSRELEVVKLIQRGLTNSEIGDLLSISISTVKKHRYSLFKKTNSKNSHRLLSYAKKLNLID